MSNNQDPLNEARVTLLIPQVLGNAESAWAVPASPTNTVPPVGQVLWVQFSGGDITRPVYSPLGIKDVQDQVGGLGSADAGLDALPPKQPTALALTTVQYVTAEGATRARVTASWTPPTENQDGTALTDLAYYVLQASYDGTNWSGGSVTTEDLVLLDGLNTGVALFVRVAAVDSSSNVSLWASTSITTASASTPPPVPSTPGVVGVLGGLRVTWDGKDVSGFLMPSIFSHVQVQRDTNTSFTNPVVVGTLPGPDTLYDSIQNYASAYSYRLVAYSKVGSASAPSAYASGTPQQAFAQDILDGSLTAAKIAVGAIDSTKLAANAVTATSIANGAVEAGKLAALAVGTINIANNAVTGAQIADATIGTAKIANLAVGTAQIADAAINNAKIANLDAGKITTGSLDANRIAAGSLDATKITAGTVTATQVLAGSITGDRLAANTVTANQIAANTITAGQIAAGGISADKLTIGTQGSINQKFYDTGSEASKWTTASGPVPTSVQVADAAVGGYVLRSAGSAATLSRPDVKIPFDPNVLYRVSVNVRQTVSNSTPGTNQGFYAGLMGYAADGTTIVNRSGINSVNSHHYVCASGASQTTGAGWVRYTGYVKGWAATGVDGSANPTPSALTPGNVHANVRYISPVMYTNYTGGTGTQEISGVTIEVVETGAVGNVSIADGAITANKILANTITAASGVIASIDASKITVGKISAGQIDATSLVISGANVSGTVSAASSATSAGTVTGSLGAGVSVPGTQVTGTVPAATTATTATSASSATSAGTVTGSIGSSVSIPASQLNNTQIPTTTTINGGSIITGTLQADRLSVGLQASLGQKLYDFGTDAAKWGKGTSSSGTLSTVAVTDAASGGYVMRATGYIQQGYRPDILIPFDPAVTYRVTARVRQVTANSTPNTNQQVYVGLTGIAADGVSLVDSSGNNAFGSGYYVAARAQALTAGSGWQTYTGYVKGTAATPTGTVVCASPTAPGSVHPNVRYISPNLYLNYNGGTGVAEMDMFTIEVVETGAVGTVNIQGGAITAALLDATAINGKTITGALVQTSASGARVAMEGTTNEVRVYSSGTTVAASVSGASPETTPGFTAYSADGSTYTCVTDGKVTFGQSTDVTGLRPRIYSSSYRQIQMSSGRSTDGLTEGYLYLTGSIAGLPFWNRPSMSVGAADGGSMAIKLQGDVTTQVLTAANIVTGRATITPSAANTPTSITISGLGVVGANPRAIATASSSVPGTQVLGVGCSGVTNDSVTIWLTRTNTTATGIDYMIIAS
uniref:Phage baseplate assembly protein V n=1 Tax=Streptomyces sp. NBC_01393 TaxID=2903851 RepID=A0AAU3IDE7_9ACTN